MMGAGHPRMSFELETFAQTQPPHFVVDDDWQKRKRTWDGVRVWAVGQALAASELLEVLLDPKRSRDGLFPELVIFDCHACHHPMSDLRWTPRHGIRPGAIRLNDSSLLMLRQIVRRSLPEAEARAFDDRVARLHRAVAGEEGDAVEEARALRTLLDAVSTKLAARSFSAQDLRATLSGLVEDGVNGRYRDYAGAEQAAMAIGSVLSFLAKRGELKDVRAANAALEALHQSLKDDEKYRPERFQAALAQFNGLLDR
jgi:hypothetical protein